MDRDFPIARHEYGDLNARQRMGDFNRLRGTAKRAQTGFLHLPAEIKNRIYELAIYDHDRTVVFLPRNHPRKVVPDVDDVDIAYSHEVKDLGSCLAPVAKQYEVHPVYGHDVLASGIWVAPEDLQAALFDAIGMSRSDVENLDDQAVLDAIATKFEYDDWTADDGFKVGLVPEPGGVLKDYPSARKFVSHETHPGCFCECHQGSEEESQASGTSHAEDPSPNNDDDSMSDDGYQSSSFFSDSDDGEPECQQINIAVQKLEEVCCICRSTETDVCASHSTCDCDICVQKRCLDSAHLDGFNIFEVDDLVDGDDYEHFDSDEDIGMRYEPREPAILLASRDIRAECLSIYYGCNAFSWRFRWTNYKVSRVRFNGWARSIPPESLKVMTKISFEGRHFCEEGVEYSIDIDLLDEAPYFQVAVEGADDNLTQTDFELERETITYLSFLLASQGGQSRPLLTADHLCNLAHIFVAAMHYDPEAGFDENARACRLLLKQTSQIVQPLTPYWTS